MIPQYLRNHEPSLKNFSLHFDYFTTWEEERQRLKAQINHHTDAAARITRHAAKALEHVHTRQRAVLKSAHDRGDLCIEITARLRTPYVSGLGGCHPTETGFILDRNTGLPYIPASAIKGVLRLAHALNLAERFPDKIRVREGDFVIPDTEESMRKYFGDTDTSAENAVRGQLVVLDAFPATVPTIRRDIMNPHFGGYYRGESPPVETENPVPVMFMAVQEGIDFKFRILALPLADGAPVDNRFGDDDREAIIAMFRRAGEQLGFGAKTAIGYGRFGEITDTREEMEREWPKIEQERKGRRSPCPPEIRRIATITDWGSLKQTVLEKATLNKWQDKPELAAAVVEAAERIRSARPDKWTADRDALVAEWLKPAGVHWEAASSAEPEPERRPARELTDEERKWVETIENMTTWNHWCGANLTMKNLPLPALERLQEKFIAWECSKQSGRPQKDWKELKKLLKKGN